VSRECGKTQREDATPVLGGSYSVVLWYQTRRTRVLLFEWPVLRYGVAGGNPPFSSPCEHMAKVNEPISVNGLFKMV